MFSDWVRRNVYWTLDFLRGSKVRKHYYDIKNMMENGTASSVLEAQENYLSDILRYATKNVDFYKPYKSYSSLKNFPVINKNIIKEHYNDFQSNEYRNSKVINMHTSGSTGTPFVVRQDANKRNRVFAEMMYFWEKAGYRLGMKYVFFRIWTKTNRKSKITSFARNIVMSDIVNLDEVNLENIRQMLKKNKSEMMLLGYASTFENLANYLIKCKDAPDMFNVKTIISGSEVLMESTRKKLKGIFNCPVVSLYSNQENGMLAQECIESKEFHINTASYFIEILDVDKDEPVKAGELGRIVITDLFNRSMPLIRYDTGDLARAKEQPECGWNTKVVSQIEGRKVDMIYSTSGVPLSPLVWGSYMWKYDKLAQYQVIQEGRKEYTINLNGAEGIYPDKDVLQTLKGVLGNDAIITINHVNEIPVLSSGKFKRTICKYDPSKE